MAWGGAEGLTIDDVVRMVNRIVTSRPVIIVGPDVDDEAIRAALREFAPGGEIASVRRSALVPEGMAYVINPAVLDRLSEPVSSFRYPLIGGS